MDEFSIKVLLLGDDKVGKSTFLSRVSCGGESLDGRASQITILRDIDQPFIFEVKGRKQIYRIEFYDTACPESWKLLRPDLVLICYDISSRPSLVNMQRTWINEIHSNFPTSDRLPMIVVGLKRDLRNTSDPASVIDPQEGYKVSQEMRVDKYVECSAVTGELLKLAFEEICRTASQTVTEAGGQSEGGCVVS